MPRVLITGAAGFIGMHTSIRFLKEGWDVVGLDNMNDYYSVALKRDRLELIKKESLKYYRTFEMFEADLNSKVWEDLIFFKFDAIIHLAAQAGVRYSIENPSAYLESNVLGFQKVLEFVDKVKAKSFVYASSSSVYGKTSKAPFCEAESCNSPESYYAATKKANEMMAYSYFKTKGVNSVGLRFFTVYGPWGRPDMAPFIFTKAAFSGEEVQIFNFGKQKRDFTYIDDIVEGVYACVTSIHHNKGCQVLNIGHGSPSSLTEFLAIIEEKTKKQLNKRLVEAQKGDVEETFADITKLSTVYGYQPKVSLERGMQRFINWFMSYYELN